MSVLLIAGSPSERSRTAALLEGAGTRLESRGVKVSRLRVRDLSPQALLLAESWSTSAAGCCTNNKWRNFDSPGLARELDAAARDQMGGQFNVLAGPVNVVGAIAMALPDQPRVLIDARPDISPWINADELFGSGVVQLLPPGTTLPGASPLPSGWSWRIFTPDDL